MTPRALQRSAVSTNHLTDSSPSMYLPSASPTAVRSSCVRLRTAGYGESSAKCAAVVALARCAT
eukprot:CAMPEP_0173125528 /NCGR_PEP_ID=MMETSP1102-20130122/56476_1 /TAXON_ID=49646 /ORGANISM="Geminigera sp., Strain Caron Lab Isolate" /LENGTH=63 /DNA_ID=CAMNT_0014034425 /DNA_START=139 /DNA_END=326 /DNA_ORIENTATION=+